MPHVSAYQLAWVEQARLIALCHTLAQPEPFAKTMQMFRRMCRVTEMMFLAGNRPKIKL